MASQAIQLSGKFEIEFPIEIDKNYELTLTGGVTSISKHSDEQGGHDYVYHLRPLYGEIAKEKGTMVKLRKKGSQSQKMRFEIMRRDIDYEKVMSKFLDHLDDILEYVKSLEWYDTWTKYHQGICPRLSWDGNAPRRLGKYA